MKNSKKMIQVVILSAILLVGGFAITDSLFWANKIPAVGDKAPNFTLQGLDGTPHQLSDYKGKNIIINFWGSFCPPCVEEMPALQKQYDKYKEGNFVVLGVNLDESTVTVQSFVKQYQLKFPILLDKDTIRKKYGVNSYPTSFIVDSKGKIVNMKVGEMSEAFIESNITSLLSK